MNRFQSSLAFGFAFVFCVVSPLCVTAKEPELVFDLTAGEIQGSAQLSTNGVASWNYGAQQFNLGFNNELTAVSLMLQRSGTGGSYAVELWSNAVVSGTSVPDSYIATVGTAFTSSLTTGPSLVSFNSSITDLSAFSDYWIVLNALSVGPGQVLWSYTDDTAGTGVAGSSFFKVDDGDGWNESYGSQRGIMSVTAVPEPSTYALAAAGLGLAGLMRARRRKAAV